MIQHFVLGGVDPGDPRRQVRWAQDVVEATRAQLWVARGAQAVAEATAVEDHATSPPAGVVAQSPLLRQAREGEQHRDLFGLATYRKSREFADASNI